MSADPYHAVQQDIQTTLQAASTLRASYVRIRSMASGESDELTWARNELKATLATLEADLETLEDSIKVVESKGPRLYNLDDIEVADRRRYVGRVRQEIQDMKAEVAELSHLVASRLSYPHGPRLDDAQLSNGRSVPAGDHNEEGHWSRGAQQLIIQEQDRTMDSISGTLTTLAEQAGLIGQEIDQHVDMLEDFEHHVDETGSTLASAMRKLRNLVRETEETKSGWCITVLVVVLVTLLVAVILV